MKKWYVCEKCDGVFSYEEIDDWTDFPRGEYLAHWDYLTTGLKSREHAERLLEYYRGGKVGEWPRYEESKPE